MRESASFKINSPNLILAHHSNAMERISTHLFSLSPSISIILHSGFFPDQSVIFIATLSHFLSCPLYFANFLFEIWTSFLKAGLSKMTNAKSFTNSILQTRTLSALFKTFVIIASFLRLNVCKTASTSSPSNAPFKFFGYTKYPFSNHSTSTNQKSLFLLDEYFHTIFSSSE